MIKFSASKILTIIAAVLLIMVIAGCGKKEDAKGEESLAAEQTTKAQQEVDTKTIPDNTPVADAGELPTEKDLDDYSAEELIDQIKNGEAPILYGGASPEALDGFFEDNSDGFEIDEEDVEDLKDFAFEEYEAHPYDPDAPWSDEEVVYETFDTTDNASSDGGTEVAEAGTGTTGDYSFLELPAGTNPIVDETDWMATFKGDVDSCKEYISKVKKAGYTIDAEDTDMMGILMYEGSNSNGERASVVYTNGSISIIFEK